MSHRQDLKANTQDELMLECVTTCKWAYKILAAETWIGKRRVETVKLMMAAWGQYILSTFLAKSNIICNWKRAALPSFFFAMVDPPVPGSHSSRSSSSLGHSADATKISSEFCGWKENGENAFFSPPNHKVKTFPSPRSVLTLFYVGWLPYLSKNCKTVYLLSALFN